MNKFYKNLYAWTKQYHEDHRHIRIYKDRVKRDMLKKMPLKFKPLFIWHICKCHYEFKIYPKIFPLSWRIRRIEKYVEKEQKKIRAGYINSRYEILDL